MSADVATPFIQSPLAVTLIGVACVTMVTLAGAAIRMLVQLAKLDASITGLREDITALKTDPDVMRWSNYGRMSQSGMQHKTGTT